MGKRKLNIELLTKVRDRIRDIPESYDQGRWVRRSRTAPCGTAACVAGDTIICSAPTIEQGVERLLNIDEEWDGWDGSGKSPGEIAAKLLRLSVPQAAVLFTGEPSDREYGWPEPFRTQWASTKSSKAKAAVAVRYITRIIETGKVL